MTIELEDVKALRLLPVEEALKVYGDLVSNGIAFVKLEPDQWGEIRASRINPYLVYKDDSRSKNE